MHQHSPRQLVFSVWRYPKSLLMGLALVIQVIFAAGVTTPTSAAVTRIKIFVGLTGGYSDLDPSYNALVAKWDDQHQDIKIEFDFHFYPNNGAQLAQNELARELTGKTPPDIVGPMGIAATDTQPTGTWTDLVPLLANDPLSKDDFTDQSTGYFKTPDGKIPALGTGVYPSFLFVNEDAFKNAGIPLPPKALGVPYVDKDGNSKPWDWDTLAEVAQQVTTDKSGKHPGDKGFNSYAISMYGFASYYNFFRDAAAGFGPQDAGLAADGKTATFDQTAYQNAVQWYQDGIFKNHFIPPKYQENQLQATSSPFESGKIAMWYSHTWFLCCTYNAKFNWTAYAPPAVSGTNGQTVISPLNADGFGIIDKSTNKDAAWQVLKWLVSDPDTAAQLCVMWNCVPNSLSARGNWLSIRPSQWSIPIIQKLIRCHKSLEPR